MYQHQQKKQLERLLVDYFKQSYSNFPVGKLVESESPDFLLTTKKKYVIGIELTRLYPVSQNPQTTEQINQTLVRDEIVEKTRSLFEDFAVQNVMVKILFSDTEKISQERILSVSVKISRKILDEINLIGEDGFNQIIIRKDLPPGIEMVLILTSKGLEYSVWERSNNLGISNDLLKDIRYSIHKKDEKLRLYQKQNLDEYWLLITTDKLCQEKSVNIYNHILNSGFNSGFKKVFILELLTGNVIELV